MYPGLYFFANEPKGKSLCESFCPKALGNPYVACGPWGADLGGRIQVLKAQFEDCGFPLGIAAVVTSKACVLALGFKKESCALGRPSASLASFFSSTSFCDTAVGYSLQIAFPTPLSFTCDVLAASTKT